MAIFALLQRIWLEIQGFTEAADRWAYLEERITVYFKWIATKIDIPGSDTWVLSLILWLAERIYMTFDKTLGKAVPDEDHRELWAGLPAPPVVKHPIRIATGFPPVKPTEKGPESCDGSD